MSYKKLLLIFFTISTICVFSQNDFKLGVDYLNNGQYKIADSLFSVYLDKYPSDINARFNRGVTRLYLADTCSFCKDLYLINNPYVFDQQAQELYSEYCAKTDTIFYTKKFEVANNSKYKYYEVIEHHKCFDFITGKIHNRKLKAEVAKINLLRIEYRKTDIFAVYQIDSENNKVYIVTDSPPRFPGGSDKLNKQLESNIYYEQLRKKFEITGARVQLIVDTTGKARFNKLISVKPHIENTDELIDYLKKIYSGLPSYKPGTFRGELVNCSIENTIVFRKKSSS